jgi:hypothetical protein
VVTVDFACSCETNVDYKNIKRKSGKNHEKETFHQKLELSLSREPVIQAKHPKELAFAANLGQLRNQQGAWTRHFSGSQQIWHTTTGS